MGILCTGLQWQSRRVETSYTLTFGTKCVGLTFFFIFYLSNFAPML
jgi:hypothetical protein